MTFQWTPAVKLPRVCYVCRTVIQPGDRVYASPWGATRHEACARRNAQ